MTAAAVPPEDSFFAVRDRAYELADTGRYKDWSFVAYALLAESFPPLMIKRLNSDTLAVMMITRVCRTKSIAAAPVASRIANWLGRFLPRPR